MIRLINRRFVPFFFNTSGLGKGGDEAAKAFVEGKLENPFAYLAAFVPDDEGTYIASSELYADKDATFEFLTELLARRPELALDTPEESAAFAAAADPNATPEALLAAATVLEELGRYERARELLGRVMSAPDLSTEQWRRGFRLLVAIARYEKRWDDVERLCGEARERQAAAPMALAADIGIELGYRALARGEYADARRILEEAIASCPRARRSGELRFYAGVASFFLGDDERADRHWCWVNENIPDDVMARRCYIAAARDGMPYPNPELGGYEAKGMPGGSIEAIKRAYAAALERSTAHSNAE